MSSQEKPIIVLVHGAWHRPLHYINIATLLRSNGYKVHAPALTTVGWDEAVASQRIADDVAIIQNVMKEHLDAGREIVVVCHSFGGFSATDSVVGETVGERQSRGEAGGVKAVIYISAFAPPTSGLSLVDLIGIKDESQLPDWWAIKDGLAILEPKATELLYSGIDPEVADTCMASVGPQSLGSFQGPCAHGTPEVTVPKTYIVTQTDSVVPVDAQRAMAAAAAAEIIELPCGHSPFLIAHETSVILEVIEKAALSKVD